MGVGLPLLELLTEAELRAVIAHEFGHYVGGDTALGPWIYRTRAAIGRTLEEVAGHSGLLAKPFEWYGTAFLRITHAVSRAQEFVADATAARIAGKDALKRALVKIAGGAPAYDGFFRSEMAPSLVRGWRPPLAAGFRQFLVAPTVAPEVAKVVDMELANTKTDPYDTHPTLRGQPVALDRLGAAAPRQHDADDTAPASTLLGDVDAAEAALLGWLTEAKVPTLTPVAWSDVPVKVLPPAWRESVEPARRALAGLTVEQLPSLARDPRQLAVRLSLAPSPSHAQPAHLEQAKSHVGCALALALVRRADSSGGQLRLDAPPGHPVRFVTDDAELEPFAVCDAFASGALTEEAWAATCARFGIAGLDLGAEVASVPSPADAKARAVTR